MRFQNLVMPAVAALVTAGAAQAQSPYAPRRPALLLHGNYCGPGNNAPLPPVDALDAACARHDACTPKGGLASPACNDRLRREAEAIANDPRQPSDLRGTAGMVAFGASLLPSGPTFAAAPHSAPAYRQGPSAPVPQPMPLYEIEADEDE